MANPGPRNNQTGDSVNLQVSAVDSAGYTLSYAATNLPDGLNIDPAAGLISGVVADDAASNTAYDVPVTVRDGVGETTSTIFNWSVAALTFNQPADQFSMEGASVSLQLSASDGLGNVMFSADGLPAGVSLNASTGLISGTIGLSAHGCSPYLVNVTASDGGAAPVWTFVWTVTPEVALLNPGDQFDAPGDTVSLALTGASTVGTLTYTLSGMPSGITINASTGVIRGTVGLSAAYRIPYAVTLTADDGTASSSATFDWTVAALALPTVADQENLDGDSISLALHAHYNGTASLSYSISGLPAGVSLNASTGLIHGTLANDADVSDVDAPYEVTATATAGSLTASQTFAWDVGPRVAMGPITDQSNVGGDSVSLAIQAGDASSGTLTYSATGLPAGLSLNASTGLISGTITSAAVSSIPDSVTLTVGDGSASVSETFNWTVSQLGMADLMGEVSSVQGQIFSLSLQGRDADGGSLSYSVTGLPAGLSLNTSTGLISGTPTSLGWYDVAATVSESSVSAGETFLWQVIEAGLRPIADQTNTEGDAISLALQGASGSGGTLNYSASDLPDGLSLNATTGVVTGTLIPGAAADGPYAVTVTVDDGVNSGSQTFNWTVNPYVSLTSLADQSNIEGNSVSLAVLATDAGSVALSYSISGLPSGVSFNASTGLISGTVASGAALTGPDAVTVTATAGAYSGSEIFNWSLTPATAPAAPVVSSLALQANQTGDEASLQVSATDSAGYTLSYAATNLPDGLSIDPAAGLISGTLANDAASNMPYTATVTVSDGVGETTSLTIHWLINPGTSPALTGSDGSGDDSSASDSSQTGTLRIGGVGVSAVAGTDTIFNPVGTFTSSDPDSDPTYFTVTIYWGDGAASLGTVTGANGVYTVTGEHTYEITGTLPMMLVVTDTVNGDSATKKGLAAVAKAPWTLTAFTEGTLVNQDVGLIGVIEDEDPKVAASAFGVTIDPGDGTGVENAVVAWQGDGLWTVRLLHGYTVAGNYTAALTATGPGGSYTAAGTAQVGNVDAGILNILTAAHFVSSDGSLAAGAYTALITWGDGGSSSGTVTVAGAAVTVTGPHTYALDGAYTLTVAVTDTAGDSFSQSQAVVVVAPPVTVYGESVVADSTGAVSSQAVAVFHDLDLNDLAGAFTATINWGDGTTNTGTVSGSGGDFVVFGGHTYTTPGVHTMQVIVSDGSTTGAASGEESPQFVRYQAPAQAGRPDLSGGSYRATTPKKFGEVVQPAQWTINVPGTRFRNGATEKGGFVLQHVIITYRLTRGAAVDYVPFPNVTIARTGLGGVQYSVPAELRDYFPGYLRWSNTGGTWTATMNYWEAWTVAPGAIHPTGQAFAGLLQGPLATAMQQQGNQNRNYNDLFAISGFPNTAGTASIVGSVYYIDGQSLPLRFTSAVAGVRGSPAGVLPSINTLDLATGRENSNGRLMDSFIRRIPPRDISVMKDHELRVQWDITGASRILASVVPKFTK